MIASESRTQKFFWNSISTALLQIIVMLSGFIIPRFMLTCYGSELNGLVTSITQFVSYFSLVEAGIAQAAVFSLYEPLACKDFERISCVVSAAKLYYYRSGVVFSLLAVGLSVIYPILKSVEDLSPTMMGLLVLALSARSFVDFFSLAKYRVLLTAAQQTYVISIASIIYQIVYILIVVILTQINVSIVAVYWIAVFAIFLRSIILKVYVKYNYKSVKFNAVPDYTALNKRWDALFLQVLGAVQSGAPVVIASIFVSLKEISVYSVYSLVTAGLNNILSIFSTSLSASFGDVIAKKEYSVLEKTYHQFLFIFYILIAFIYACAFVLIREFVLLYTRGINDIDYNKPVLGGVLVLNGFLYNLKTPQGMLIGSAGHYKETKIQTAVQAIIIVLGGVILAPKYGLIGIMVASCIANLYRVIDLAIYVPSKITHTSILHTVKYMFISILMFLGLSLLGLFLPVKANSFFTWILKAIIICIEFFAVINICMISIWKQEKDSVTMVIRRLFRGRKK